MEVQLTKDAQKMMAVIYKAYLEKRKAGSSKKDAKAFTCQELKDLFPNENEDDIDETIVELKRTVDITCDIIGGIALSDSSICYMENKFKNGIKDVLSFLSQFIP